MSKKERTLLYGINVFNEIEYIKSANNRLKVDSNSTLINYKLSDYRNNISLLPGKDIILTLNLNTNLAGILISCNTLADFNNLDIYILYSVDGTNFHLDDGITISPTNTGKYYNNFLIAFKSIRLIISNNSGNAITLSAGLSNG